VRVSGRRAGSDEQARFPAVSVLSLLLYVGIYLSRSFVISWIRAAPLAVYGRALLIYDTSSCCRARMVAGFEF
jgi:hypothetical protein